MHVVEEDRERLRRRDVREECPDRLEEAEARAIARVCDGAGEIWQPFPELRQHHGEIVATAAEAAQQLLRFEGGDTGAEGLKPRPVRGGPAGFPAAACEYTCASAAGLGHGPLGSLRARGEHDQRGRGEVGVGAHLGGHLQPVLAGHVHVEQHHAVGLAVPGCLAQLDEGFARLRGAGRPQRPGR